MHKWSIIRLFVAFLISQSVWAADHKRTEIVEIDESTNITISIYPEPTDFLILWVPPEYGVAISEAKLALYLGAGRNEVWIPDFLGARFLPPAASSLRDFPAEDVATVIEAAHVKTKKSVFLVAADRGAGLLLRGAMAWRNRYPASSALKGAILWHPQLYANLPNPGKEAKYMDEVGLIALPIFIFQPKLSPGRWRLKNLISAFEAGDSLVQTKLLPGVRDRFFLRQDPDPIEDSMSTLVNRLHYIAVSQLRSINKKSQ